VVLSINLSPMGMAEGIIAKSKNDVAQINFAPDVALEFSRLVKVGDIVEVTIVPDNQGPNGPPGGRQGPGGMGPGPGGPGGENMNGPGAGPMGGMGPGGMQAAMPAHPLFRLLVLRTADGKTVGMEPGRQSFARVEGTIKALNYDRRGTTNGAQLDTGDLVRLGPREAQRVELKVGARITAEGMAFPLPTGKLSLQAQRVNDQDVRPQPPGQEGPGGPGEPGGAGDQARPQERGGRGGAPLP
jgi:hypothetical protein